MTIKIFPGSKSDYEGLVGYQTEVVEGNDTNQGIRMVMYETFRQGIVLENPHPKRPTIEFERRGIEAIVNAQRHVIEVSDRTKVDNYETIVEYYGLPVKRKE